MRTAFGIGLALWLTLSLASWLFGFAFAGGPVLPAVNPFTFFVLYAPLLILLTIGFRALGLRKKKIAD